MTTPEANTLFPGLPGYVGPSKGWFAFIHHDTVCGYSPDIMERVHYILDHKPKWEVDARLRHLLTLPEALGAELGALAEAYEAAFTLLEDEYVYKRAIPFYAYSLRLSSLRELRSVKAKPLTEEALAFAKTHIPNGLWNGKELMFPPVRS